MKAGFSPSARSPMVKSPMVKSPMISPMVSPSAKSPMKSPMKSPIKSPIATGPKSPTVLVDKQGTPKAKPWIRPSRKTLSKEYMNAYSSLNKTYLEDIQKFNVFPTEELFLEAVENAPMVEWNRGMNSYTENRSNISNLKSIYKSVQASRYSLDSDRTVELVDELYIQIKDKEPVEAPIVFRLNERTQFVLSGNLRLDFAFVQKLPCEVILVNVQSIMQSRFPDLPQDDFFVSPAANGKTQAAVFRSYNCKEIEFEQVSEVLYEIHFHHSIYRMRKNLPDDEMCTFEKVVPNNNFVKLYTKYELDKNKFHHKDEQSLLFDKLDPSGQTMVYSATAVFKSGSQLKESCEILKMLEDTLDVRSFAKHPQVIKAHTIPFFNFKLGPDARFVLRSLDIQMALKNNQDSYIVFFKRNYLLDFNSQERAYALRDEHVLMQNEEDFDITKFWESFQASQIYVQESPDAQEKLMLERYENLAKLLPEEKALKEFDAVVAFQRFMTQIHTGQFSYNKVLRKALQPTQIEFLNYEMDVSKVREIVQDFLGLARYNEQLGLGFRGKTYRGFSQPNSETWPQVFLKKGNLFTVDTLLSTSKEPKVAYRFGEPHGKDAAIFLEVDVDKSVPHIDVNGILQKISCQNNCSISNEQEILIVPSIQPRTVFLVQTVEKVTTESLSRSSFPELAKYVKDQYSFLSTKKPKWQTNDMYFVKLVPQTFKQRSTMVGGRVVAGHK